MRYCNDRNLKKLVNTESSNRVVICYHSFIIPRVKIHMMYFYITQSTVDFFHAIITTKHE